MNFLLYMIGRGSRAQVTRMSGRDALLASAAGYLAAGQFERALSAQDELVRTGNSMDLLIRGHLHLLLKNPRAAKASFVDGIEGLLKYPGGGELEDADTCIDRLLGDAARHLNDGRFTRATHAVRKARSIIEVLLAAHGGMLLSGEQRAVDIIMSLVTLSDTTLHMLARIHLARDLSTEMRSRHLRDDLAPWATSTASVDRLLAAEITRLSGTAEGAYNAESEFRLGILSLVTRADGEAAAAFEQVLRFHPFHVPSAVRLFARDNGSLSALRVAYRVPAETLALFAQLARLVSEAKSFDAAANSFRNRAGESGRALLAFALSEMALLDESRETWREPSTAAA